MPHAVGRGRAVRAADRTRRSSSVREGSVVRERVLDLLRTSTAPVITVVAPSGYGKSTLLAQWAAGVRDPVVWLSIDDADHDPVVFLRHLAAALDELDGGSAFATPRLGQPAAGDDGDDPR